jgi:hypothetical protein
MNYAKYSNHLRGDGRANGGPRINSTGGASGATALTDQCSLITLPTTFTPVWVRESMAATRLDCSV